MNIEKRDKDIILYGIKDFNLGQTLECGQCFHFLKIGDNEYVISAMGHFLHVSQDDSCDVTFYNTTQEEYEKIWVPYFDIERDYGEIKRQLLAKDNKLKEAMETMWGVRILNQDFFETMISFIISQNKQIPHIKKIVWEISRKYGKRLEGAENFALGDAAGVGYAFPAANALIAAGEDGMRECKTGFRAPYIINACDAYYNGMLTAELLRSMTYENARAELVKVKGIGEKVANCILLFGLGKRNAFPVDVWIKRIMESIYIGHEADKAQIGKMATELFGEYGGYAQQYLFYFGKENKLGVKQKKIKNL